MISLAEASQQLAADLVPQALENTWKFFTDGGVFMGLIVGCSMVALAANVTIERSRPAEFAAEGDDAGVAAPENDQIDV